MKKRKLLTLFVMFVLLATVFLTSCVQGFTFVISYDVNGGSFIAPQKVLQGEIAKQPDDPIKDGYNFDGWYLNKNFGAGSEYLFNTPVTEDITIYAKWSKKEVFYTVTFNTMGASNIPAQTVKGGQSAIKPADPKKEDFTFGGWYEDITCTIPYNFGPVAQNTTIYAKWTIDAGVPVYIDKSSSYIQQQNAMGKTDGEEAFINRNDLFTYVGDDNDYLLPIVLKDNYDNVVVNDSHVEVLVKMGDTTLDETYYEAVGAKVKFKHPIDGIVSITAILGTESVTFPNIKVVDGYNVYSAADLAHVTHTVHKAHNTITILRSADIKTNAILLQNNLYIKNEDFNGVYGVFETAEQGDADKAVFDTLKDGKALRDNVYLFMLAMGKNNNVNSFDVGDQQFIGNYFTIDLTQLAPVVRENGEIKQIEYDNENNITNVISNSSYLFGILNKNDYIMKNLNIVGNSGVPDMASAFRNSGGCGAIEVHLSGTDVTINNVNSKFAITFLSVSMRGNEDVVTLSDSKVLNCFAQAIFVSISTLKIDNCILKDCGGPLLFLASAIDKTIENPTGMPTIEIDDKTVMENWVTGSEAWFKINDAEMLGTVFTSTGAGTLAAALSNYGRTILQKKGNLDCFNFIALTLDSYHFGEDNAALYYSYSNITIKNSLDPSNDIHLNHNPRDPKFKVVAQDNAKKGQASLITTSANGYVGFPQELCAAFGLNYDINNANCAKGDYLNVETDLGGIFYGSQGAGQGGTIGGIVGYYPLS